MVDMVTVCIKQSECIYEDFAIDRQSWREAITERNGSADMLIEPLSSARFTKFVSFTKPISFCKCSAQASLFAVNR